MKFAFSTVACPKWDFPTIAARAKEYGYGGVEIRGYLNESALTAANVFQSEPAKVRETFAAGGIAIACLSSSIAMTGSAAADQRLAGDLLKYIETSAALGCPLVRILGPKQQSGRSLTEVAGSFAQWLAPMAEAAADRGITIVIENSPPFRRAREIWTTLEVLNHPAVAAGWDVLSAALVGETPAVGIPVLNNRLSYVVVKDAVIQGSSAAICRLGDGNLALRELCNRLRGVGYGGWMCLDWPKASLAALAEPEEVLPAALAKLREWTTPKVAPKPAKPEAKKPAAAASAEAKKPGPATPATETKKATVPAPVGA